MSVNPAPDNYTPHAQAAIAAARSEVERFGLTGFGPEQLLRAILTLPHCGAVKALARLGVSTEAVERGLKNQPVSRKGAALTTDYLGKFWSMTLLEFVTEVAQELRKPGYACAGTEHLLLGILFDRDSLPAQVLHELGVTAKQVQRVIAESGAAYSPTD
jgi:ATP-dependent Clp protease ATP-binding subunit ClpC